MQVINLTNNILKYYTKGTKIELKPGIITYVSDDIISAEKLKSCYGSRINIIDETKIGEVYKEYAGNAKPVEPPVKEVEVKTEKEIEEIVNKTEDKVEPAKENKTEDKVEPAKPSTKATKSKTSTKKVSKGKSTKSKKNK